MVTKSTMLEPAPVEPKKMFSSSPVKTQNYRKKSELVNLIFLKKNWFLKCNYAEIYRFVDESTGLEMTTNSTNVIL